MADNVINKISIKNAYGEYETRLIGGTKQYTEMPIPSYDYIDIVAQYIGETTANFINGYFYKCNYDEDEDTYSWEQINVQPGGGGSASALSDLTDVELTNLAQGNELIYDGTKWINKASANIQYYDLMPTDTELFAMKNNTIFSTIGYYSLDDGNGGLYKITTTWTKNTKRIVQGANTRYLLVIDDEGWQREHLNLGRLGVRRYNSTQETLTAENTYATNNSDVLDAILDSGTMTRGNTWYLPSGRYFFERPISLAYQRNLCGDKIPDMTYRALLNNAFENACGTILYFPFLENGQTGITSANGVLSDITVIGSCSPNLKNYDFTIDRTKTITAPDEVVTEVIAQVDDVDYKTTGIKKSAAGNVDNVRVAGFYTGFEQTSGTNLYMNNIFARNCHYGYILTNDAKVRGVYGWDVHTLVYAKYSLISVVQLRIDSCVHALEMLGTKSCNFIDVDGDYCTDNLIYATDNCNNNTLFGIHGRCCTLKAYNKNTDPDGIDVRDLSDTSGYGLIRYVGNYTSFKNNYIVANSIGGSNPFDTTSSDYLTPKILFTYSNSNNPTIIDNYFVVAESLTEDSILKSIQTTRASFQAKIDGTNDTFILNGNVVGRIGKYKNLGNFSTLNGAGSAIYSDIMNSTSDEYSELYCINVSNIGYLFGRVYRISDEAHASFNVQENDSGVKRIYSWSKWDTPDSSQYWGYTTLTDV